MILITGATGNVGRPLVDLLHAAGARVRAVSRHPDTAGLPDGVAVVAGDPRRPDTLDEALPGVTSVFLNGQATGEAAAEVVARARSHGARRIVALSAINVDDALERQPSRLRGARNREAERAAVDSGLEWVALRPNYFATNLIGTWGAQIRAGDTVRGTHPGASWAPIHERDIAAVAAHALLHDDLLGRRPVLTGPRALTQPEMVTVIGDAIGRRLRFAPIPPEAARQGMVDAGFDPDFARGVLDLLAESYGMPGTHSGEVERILGRPGLSLAEWAVDHARDFSPAGVRS
ncbi:MAG TPA: NAD(P)H-binding protein [Stackebrandtia sp.]|jgi:uncharacterized protein YbjT (DUF2867 family)|uniref:NAD(P)H-binding protein n=1 Tax=Stackebrandtia sp. TaxID=2023065 RepID=UPI002D471BF9|nr:NAD(P)H-binding protein [Stackebrandtia sp.]HZE38343.1 NAD(P)H-binding protein [Stackebrandtia sp.]